MSDSVDRVKGKRIVKPIVYGNTARPFGYKRESDGHTHTWTVFLKPYHNEDISKYIRKVQFKLHDSYANAVRTVDHPPFEVTETGWGEFDVQIKMFFDDPHEKPITAFHYLRLFQPVFTNSSGEPVVVVEYYDEIVFQEPTVRLNNVLTSMKAERCDAKRFRNNLSAKKNESLAAINAARAELGREIEDLRETLKQCNNLLIKHAEDAGGDESERSTPAPQ